MDIQFTPKSITDVKLRDSDDTLSAMAALDIKFIVNMANGTSEVAVDLFLSNLNLNFTVEIVGMNMTGNITNFKVGDLEQVSCTFGDLHADTLKVIINSVFKLYKKSINFNLAKMAVVLPTELFGLFTLDKLTLKYFDDYVLLGITPTFLPPSFLEGGSYVFHPDFVMPVHDDEAQRFLQ